MPDPHTLLAIAVMALVTYATRVTGSFVLRDRTPSPRVAAVLQAVPGCVLLAVIAPAFATGRLADLLALAITTLAATRAPMLPTVLIGVASAGLLRHLL
jgi:uncharacterized membrane protein